MGIKLFVDDLRECPIGWVPARTVTEAIRILATQNVNEVSLDHDIQCSYYEGDIFKERHASPESFEPVAYFLCMMKLYHFGTVEATPWNTKVRIHTSNFEAGRRMAKIMGVSYTNYIYNPEDYV